MSTSIVHEVVELRGHIIDSWTLPRAWDIIMDRGGNFDVQEMRVGTHKTEPSYIRLKVLAPDDEVLDRILTELQQLGAVLTHAENAHTAVIEQDGVLPDKFYSTTNLPTQVRVNGQWVDVEHIEMDVAVVIEQEKRRAYCKPMHEVRVGDYVVIGHGGIRVQPFERDDLAGARPFGDARLVHLRHAAFPEQLQDLEAAESWRRIRHRLAHAYLRPTRRQGVR